MKICISYGLILFIVLSLPHCAFARDRQQAEYWFEQARHTDIETEKITLLKKAINSDPRYIPALFELGEIYLAQEAYSLAREQFSAIITIDSKNSLALERLGDTTRKLQKYDEAKTFYITAFKRDQENKRAYFKTVDICLEQNQLNEAKTRIQTFFTEYGSTYADAWYYWGALNLKKHNFDEAETGFKSAVKYAHNQKHELAQTGLKQLDKLKQTHKLAQQIDKVFESENIAGILADIAQYQKLAPHDTIIDKWFQRISQIYAQRAREALQQNDKTTAFQWYRKALEYDPSNTHFAQRVENLAQALDQDEIVNQNYQLAKKAMNQGKYELVIRHLKQIMRLDPNYKDVRQLLTRAESQKAASTPTRDQPSTATLSAQLQQLFNTGQELCASNQWLAARAKFQEILDQKPEANNVQAWYYFAEGSHHLDQAQWKTALMRFNKALTYNANDSLIFAGKLYAQAQISLSNEAFTDALGYLNRLATLNRNFRDVDSLMQTVQVQTQAAPADDQWAIYLTALLLSASMALLLFIWLHQKKKRKDRRAFVPSSSDTLPIAEKTVVKSVDEIDTIVKPRTEASSEQTAKGTQNKNDVLLIESSLESEEKEILFLDSGLRTRKKRGRYEIRRQIGQGAMGRVYQAFDHKMKRLIVLKEIRVEENLNRDDYEKLAQRFLREARSAGRLHHPNIVTVFDIIHENGILYIAMEYLDGINLLELINERKQIPMRMVLDIISQAALALEFAHQAGIVHRDIKPSNLMYLPNGRLKIVDFGVAKVADSTTLTQFGNSLGTPSYMSPEQIEGLKVDGRSDIFSLGIVFYELLTSEKPFKGESMASIIVKILQMEPRKVTDIRNDIPVEVEKIINKMLAKNPDKRYHTASELINDLNAVIIGL